MDRLRCCPQAMPNLSVYRKRVTVHVVPWTASEPQRPVNAVKRRRKEDPREEATEEKPA
jgi:hypothetical protein